MAEAIKKFILQYFMIIKNVEIAKSYDIDGHLSFHIHSYIFNVCTIVSLKLLYRNIIIRFL